MGPGPILPGASAWWMRSSTRRDFWSPSTSIALQEQPFLRWGLCPAASSLWGGSVLQGLDENRCQDPPGCIPLGYAGLCPLGRTQHLPALTTSRMDLARASQSSSAEPFFAPAQHLQVLPAPSHPAPAAHPGSFPGGFLPRHGASSPRSTSEQQQHEPSVEGAGGGARNLVGIRVHPWGSARVPCWGEPGVKALHANISWWPPPNIFCKRFLQMCVIAGT